MFFTDDLENIYSLVREAKIKGPLTIIRIVNKMMVGDFFLYGLVSTNLKRKMKEAICKLPNELSDHIRAECKRHGFLGIQCCVLEENRRI
jgi:hypothetical protein